MAISAETRAEFQGVLEGKKFRYPSDIVRSIFNELLAVSELVRPLIKVEQIKADPPDNRILECALESKAACIVTGDRHLLELGEFEGIPILDVASFHYLFSDFLLVRLPSRLHRKASISARREGKSLNQWIAEKLDKVG